MSPVNPHAHHWPFRSPRTPLEQAAYTFGVGRTCGSSMDDGGFNLMTVAGMDAVASSHDDVRYETFEICSAAELLNSTANRSIDHWICPGFDLAPYAAEAAAAFPATKFSLIDAALGGFDNVQSAMFAEDQVAIWGGLPRGCYQATDAVASHGGGERSGGRRDERRAMAAEAERGDGEEWWGRSWPSSLLHTAICPTTRPTSSRRSLSARSPARRRAAEPCAGSMACRSRRSRSSATASPRASRTRVLRAASSRSTSTALETSRTAPRCVLLGVFSRDAARRDLSPATTLKFGTRSRVRRRGCRVLRQREELRRRLRRSGRHRDGVSCRPG